MLKPNLQLETSVGRIEDLGCKEILQLGIDFGSLRKETKPVRGWLEFSESALLEIESAKLEIRHDTNPERHSNILGWPPETADQLIVCDELFMKCTRRASFDPAISAVNEVETPCNYVEEINHT